jgi:hypothetical protein
LKLGKSAASSTYPTHKKDMEEVYLQWVANQTEVKHPSPTDGIVVEGYLLGTFDFESLSGHPGIKY